MSVIQKELKRGGNITDQIMLGKAQWKDLFAKHTFFTEGYKYYLSVISASTSKEEQMLWAGFVESKVRLLIAKIEDHDSISIAHPFNKGFTRVHRCRTQEEIEQVKTGSMNFHAKDIATATTGHGLTIEAAVTQVESAVNGGQEAKDDDKITEVYTTSHYIGLQLREGKWSIVHSLPPKNYFCALLGHPMGLQRWVQGRLYRLNADVSRC
jgi:poly(A) polymerase